MTETTSTSTARPAAPPPGAGTRPSGAEPTGPTSRARPSAPTGPYGPLGPSGRSLVLPTPDLTSFNPRWTGGLVALWFVVALFGMLVVAFGFGPFLFQRDQSVLLHRYKTTVDHAANEAFGIQGVAVPIKAPEMGDPVALMEIGDLRLQQAVVEGVSPGETLHGPGHVPGTAGLGQPGNSVIVGRHATYGGAFAQIDQLQTGNQIVLTTTQGQFVYKVDSVGRRTVLGPEAAPASPTPGTAPQGDATDQAISVDQLYGPTEDDRLTLVTSNTSVLWNSSEATVVVAKMVEKPFVPTPQNGRTDSQTGLAGDPSALTTLTLILAGLAGAVVMAVVLYRTRSAHVAYLLSVPPLLAIVVMGGETLSRLLPAWA
jgi:sortase A